MEAVAVGSRKGYGQERSWAGRIDEMCHSISCVVQRQGINPERPGVPSGTRYLLRNTGERVWFKGVEGGRHPLGWNKLGAYCERPLDS